MKYAVDQIINDIVILENLETKEHLEINKNLLNFNVEEGNIIIALDGSYALDKKEEEEVRKRIESKLERLKNLQNES